MQVCNHLGLDELQEIKKSKAVSVLALRKRFLHAVRLRGDHLPGDLEIAVEHQARAKCMFQAESALEVLSVQGKYGPWKDALLEHWQKSQTGRRRRISLEGGFSESVQLRAARVLPVLTAAAFQMDGDPQEAWVANCGRQVSKVLGWLALLSRLGAIKHLRGTEGRGKKCLLLGAAQQQYVWMPDGQAPVLDALAKICRAGDVLQASLQTAPRTCTVWLEALRQVESQLKTIAAPGLSATSPYVLPWTFRTMAVARMRHHGVARLGGASKVTVKDLTEMFPDQCDWLMALHNHFRRSEEHGAISAQRLLDLMEYKGPIELFTMDLCLAGDAGLQPYTAALLKGEADKMQAAAEAYFLQHGLWPHLAVVLQSLGK